MRIDPLPIARNVLRHASGRRRRERRERMLSSGGEQGDTCVPRGSPAGATIRRRESPRDIRHTGEMEMNWRSRKVILRRALSASRPRHANAIMCAPLV